MMTQSIEQTAHAHFFLLFLGWLGSLGSFLLGFLGGFLFLLLFGGLLGRGWARAQGGQLGDLEAGLQ